MASPKKQPLLIVSHACSYEKKWNSMHRLVSEFPPCLIILCNNHSPVIMRAYEFESRVELGPWRESDKAPFLYQDLAIVSILLYRRDIGGWKVRVHQLLLLVTMSVPNAY